MGTGIEILDRQVAGNKLAIAVGEIGAGDGDMIGKAGRARVAHHGHVDQAHTHQRKSGDAESRSDNDAPLDLAHFLTYPKRKLKA